MTIEFPTVFDEVAAVLTVAIVIAFIGEFLRQPLIVSFIIAWTGFRSCALVTLLSLTDTTDGYPVLDEHFRTNAGASTSRAWQPAVTSARSSDRIGSVLLGCGAARVTFRPRS